MVLREQDWTFIVAVALTGAIGVQLGCSSNRGTTTESSAQTNQAASGDATTSPGVRSDPASERQVITLTGCLQRGASPSEFMLASVATAGVTDVVPGATQATQQGAAETTAMQSQAALMAETSYRLVALGDDDLAQFDGKRVAVSGRLAAEAPASAAPARSETGTQVEDGPTSATVAAQAPALRGFYVQSIRKIDDDCSAGTTSKRRGDEKKK
jgi:hypothetical protein